MGDNDVRRDDDGERRGGMGRGGGRGRGGPGAGRGRGGPAGAGGRGGKREFDRKSETRELASRLRKSAAEAEREIGATLRTMSRLKVMNQTIPLLKKPPRMLKPPKIKKRLRKRSQSATNPRL